MTSPARALGDASGDGIWAAAARRVAAVAGWRRYGLAGLLGAFAALALAPVHAFPVLLVSFTGLIWQLDGARSARSGFAVGWWFGFGYFVAGLYWIAIALLTEPEKFGWMIPFAVGGLSAYLALFTGVAALLTRLVGSGAPGGAGRVGKILVLAGGWAVMEWARGVLFTGFPWNPLGSVWAFSPAMMQFASVAGVFGLGLVTVVIAAAPAALGAGDGRGRVPVLISGLALAAMWVGGAMRLPDTPANQPSSVTLRLVQANIAQDNKWRADLRARQFARYLRLSAQQSTSGAAPTHVIWPETAAPLFLADEPAARQAIARVVPPGGALITGTLRSQNRRPGQPRRIWNSLQAVDDRGAVIGSYDKFHLVPFGEYVPFRSILSFSKITRGMTDFSAGPGPRTLRLDGLPPFSPLICYEVIFPGAVTDRADRPSWILNVTNDAWFGISSGPYQHFASARMRAVEEGLPVARAANTGISGVVDGYGRIVARLGLGVEGVVDAPLPPALPVTIYARWGNPILAGLILAAMLGGWGCARRGRRRVSAP
jgi:apolipoprotein N-acyltransferase